MTNDAIKQALSASAILMRQIAAGRSPQDADKLLRYWAGQLERTRDELTNRDAATRTLITTFRAWETIQVDGFVSDEQPRLLPANLRHNLGCDGDHCEQFNCPALAERSQQ